MFKKIDFVFNEYKSKFTEGKYKETRLTEYEEAFGFDEETRKGSKPFCNVLGNFMEDIWCSSGLIKQKGKGIDAVDETSFYQFKNRHDTMKGSLANKEIEPMLKKAILENKNFYLVILTDKNNSSRNIPLHLGNCLSKLSGISGYNPVKHRWISGDEAYKHFFGTKAKKIKKYILSLLFTLSRQGV